MADVTQGDEVTVQMRFAMAMTQADGDLCDEELALFYMQWLKRNGLSVIETTALTAKEAELAAERAKIEKLREALTNLVEEYTMNVDSFRTGGFYTDPETEEVIIAARATLAETQPQERFEAVEAGGCAPPIIVRRTQP